MKRWLQKWDKKGEEAEHSTITTLIIVMLCIVLGLAFLYYIWKLKGRVAP